jgi:hypothetical protein
MDSQQMTDAIQSYPNALTGDELEKHLLELYPVYRPNRVAPVQQAEPEPQQDSQPVIEVTPEIAAPPVETDEPIEADAKEPKRISALKNVYAWASGPLSIGMTQRFHS